MRRIALILFGLVVLMLIVAWPGTARTRLAESVDKSAEATVTLKEVNGAARSAYSAAREHMLSAMGPIVVWNGEDLVFRYRNYRRVSHPTPALYHDLKTISHVALGLHSLVVPYGDGRLDDYRLFAFKQYRDTIRKARPAIRNRGLTDEQLTRQRKILRACEEYITHAIENAQVDIKRFNTFIRNLRPSLELNNDEAARSQIDGLHREMNAYQGKISRQAWKSLVVIIQGSQMPRKDNLAVQYFSRLLEVKGEGERIIYAEGLFDETKALNLLGTKRVDTVIGETIWSDPLHMHRDLLADSAKKYLDALFGKQK